MKTENRPANGPSRAPTAAVLGCLLPVITLCLCLVGCDQGSNAPKGSDLTGTYNLVTVNGNKLPASVSHDGASLQVRSGTFTINADGTCSTKTVFVPPTGAEATREVSATYTREGEKLNMQWKGAGRTTGTIDGKRFTMDNEGMVFVYKK